MDSTDKFDDIRPFNDNEVSSAIESLAADQDFRTVFENALPDTDFVAFIKNAKKSDTIRDFQHNVIKNVVYKIVGKTSTSLSFSGVENVKQDVGYTYMSNHRDIVLDASILCVLLVDAGLEAVEIAIGDNLLIKPWIRTLVRLNRSFIVKRGLSGRSFLEASLHMSQYVNATINEKHQSVWIAQREGRAKDSDDRTQSSLLKMLSLGGSSRDFLSNIMEVNIIPLSISYEYDPCDFLKAWEFQEKRDCPDYKKTEAEDLLNMKTGMTGFKGNIHFRIGRPINPFLKELPSNLDKHEVIEEVAGIIDREIFLNYKFYPLNYIAYDELYQKSDFKDHYTEKDIVSFHDYINKKLSLIELKKKDAPFLQEKLLEMYANPLKNYLSVV